ncbi:MAG: hypothetical protein EOM67_16760 [Spirochaetia bacterium]|nr:hypothetical protein [Spirochaetia bacterium]
MNPIKNMISSLEEQKPLVALSVWLHSDEARSLSKSDLHRLAIELLYTLRNASPDSEVVEGFKEDLTDHFDWALEDE